MRLFPSVIKNVLGWRQKKLGVNYSIQIIILVLLWDPNDEPVEFVSNSVLFIAIVTVRVRDCIM